MKFVSLLVGLCMVSNAAIAQTSTCQSILKASQRLACYDRLTPPTAEPKKATGTKSTSAKSAPERAAIVDRLAVENKKLDARLKTICRGC